MFFLCVYTFVSVTLDIQHSYSVNTVYMHGSPTLLITFHILFQYTVGENTIRFGSVVTKKCGFLLDVICLFHRSLIYICINHSKGVWNSVFIVWWSSFVKIWMEGTYDMPYKNPYFFVLNQILFFYQSDIPSLIQKWETSGYNWKVIFM